MRQHTLPQNSRTACWLALAAFTLILSPATARAQTDASAWPTHPVKLVVPFPAGGGADTQARMIAERLSQEWTQPVTPENVSGAGGAVAANAVARSKPDGQTLFFATHPILAISPFMTKKLPYDPVKDFTPVIKLIEAPLVLLVPVASPVRTVADLVRLAKEKPGSINFGSGGIGTTQHLAGELLKLGADIDMTHVPYRGNAQTAAALITNEIQMHFDGVPSAVAQIKGGRVRGIAVTSKKRLTSVPELPTLSETLPDFEVSLAYGLLVPAGTPADVVAKINRSANAAIREAAYTKRISGEGATIEGGTPKEFADFLARERAKWGPLIKRLNIEAE